jgi:hypothetical protein
MSLFHLFESSKGSFAYVYSVRLYIGQAVRVSV